MKSDLVLVVAPFIGLAFLAAGAEIIQELKDNWRQSQVIEPLTVPQLDRRPAIGSKRWAFNNCANLKQKDSDGHYQVEKYVDCIFKALECDDDECFNTELGLMRKDI